MKELEFSISVAVICPYVIGVNTNERIYLSLEWMIISDVCILLTC